MRFGLIGCGEIGLLRAAALSAIRSHELVSVCDIDHNKASTLAAKSSAKVVNDWRRLLETDLDAVIISTPPSLHAEISVAASCAGKHVLCEKPLARTPEECESMVRAAEDAGRVLASGFNYRFYPPIKKARELLDSGIIGDLNYIRSYTGYSASTHNRDWLHDAEIMGGGTMWDNGIHLIDLTCYFLGDVTEIKGFASGDVWRYPNCEDNAFVLLKNQAGNIASLQTSWTEWRGYRLVIDIYGNQGCIRAVCFPMFAQLVVSEPRGKRAEKKVFVFPKFHIMEKLRSYRWIVIQSFIEEFKEFSRAVDGLATPLSTGRDGLLAINIAATVSKQT